MMESSGLVAVPSGISVLPVGPGVVKEEPASLEVQDGCGEGTGAGGSKQKQKAGECFVVVLCGHGKKNVVLFFAFLLQRVS